MTFWLEISVGKYFGIMRSSNIRHIRLVFTQYVPCTVLPLRGVNLLTDEQKKDDIFYVCTLIEYIARKTKNHRSDLIRYFTKPRLRRQLRLAPVNHCLSFEQVADELIEEYGISYGTYDTVAECKYTVPAETAIGRVYQQLVWSVSENDDYEQAIIDVFSSFISDEISDFNSSVYYQNPDYLKCSYEDGKLLA